ncbi:MAG: arginine--tRNA ligase, partial [Firmicutes bacterium]|nr:arginine--tRNA ligase [Bacillota bacterium]
RIKDVVFDMDKMTSFEGETGPYVQYTHARCASLISKASDLPETFDYSLLDDEASLAVCRLFETFPDKIRDAAAKNEPYIVSRHIMAIAQAFNKFYHDNPVLSCEDENLRNARLAVVMATRIVLATGLGLLGIKAPERM